MGRARYADVVTDPLGRPVAGTVVDVFNTGTTTPVAGPLYAAATGATTLANPFTVGPTGEAVFFLDAPARVDLRYAKTGYAAETHTVDVLDAEHTHAYAPTAHTHSGAYAPLAGATMWLSAQDFTAAAGSPVLALTGGGSRFMGWQFDAAVSERVNTTFASPTGWLTYAVDLYWGNSGAGVGDAVWALTMSQRADGDSLTAGDAIILPDTASTAPTLDVLKVTSSNAVTVDTAKPLSHLRINRNAAAGTDTLANDAAVFGVMLRRIT